jgi:hypothetical protein
MKPLGAMITGIMTKTLKKKGVLESGQIKLLTHWSKIVGMGLSQRSKPLKLKNAILTIAASSGAALELQHQSDEIIAKVNNLLEYEGVKRIKFIQRDISAD